MGMTAVEKILARASGLASVQPGDVIEPRPDWMFLHDNYVMGPKLELDKLGIRKLFDPARQASGDHRARRQHRLAQAVVGEESAGRVIARTRRFHDG